MSSLSFSLCSLVLAFSVLFALNPVLAQTDPISKNYYRTGIEFAKLRAIELKQFETGINAWIIQLGRHKDMISRNRYASFAPSDDFERAVYQDGSVEVFEKTSEEIRRIINTGHHAQNNGWATPMLVVNWSHEDGAVGYLTGPLGKELYEFEKKVPPLPELPIGPNGIPDLGALSGESKNEEYNKARRTLDAYLNQRALLVKAHVDGLLFPKPLKLKVDEVDKTGILYSYHKSYRPIFVKYEEVPQVTKGQEVELTQPVEWLGNKPTPYNFQNTYRVLTDQEILNVKAYIKSRNILKLDKFYRTWTDSSGTKKVEALFVDVVDGNVNLKSENGKPLSIPRESLAKRDLSWLEQNYRFTIFREGEAVLQFEGFARPSPN